LSDTDRPDHAARVHGGRAAGDAWRDPEVLRGVRQRDEEALGRFFDTSFPYVYSIAMRLTGNRETAQDITQEVFLKVYRAADRLDTDRDPKPWLTTITYNACRDLGRRAAARPEVAVDALKVGERQPGPDTPEDELLRRERERLVERALLELDVPSRAAVILYDYCGLSHEEIAKVMGASHAGIRKRYSRALKRMAEIIRGFEK
jgi:RNA polymerase sigma factor (sigma-70 family)